MESRKECPNCRYKIKKSSAIKELSNVAIKIREVLWALAPLQNMFQDKGEDISTELFERVVTLEKENEDLKKKLKEKVDIIWKLEQASQPEAPAPEKSQTKDTMND